MGSSCSSSAPSTPTALEVETAPKALNRADEVWHEYRGYEIEPPLRSGAIALLDAAWLVRLADSGGLLTRRQEMPREAFMSLDELKATGQSADGLRIIAVSQCVHATPNRGQPHDRDCDPSPPALPARPRTW
jgi:hypothetical protein